MNVINMYNYRNCTIIVFDIFYLAISLRLKEEAIFRVLVHSSNNLRISYHVYIASFFNYNAHGFKKYKPLNQPRIQRQQITGISPPTVHPFNTTSLNRGIVLLRLI